MNKFKSIVKPMLTGLVLAFLSLGLHHCASINKNKDKNDKTMLNYRIYPDCKDVVVKFFDTYAINSKHYPYETSFEKRPTGWHVALYKNGKEKIKVRDKIFWSRENNKYQITDFDTLFIEPEENPEIKGFLNEHLMFHYSVCQYYGYPGWDWDVIQEYEEVNNLPDSILYGLAYAYSSYASNLLHNNSGMADPDHQFDLPDGKNSLTDEQLEKYRTYSRRARGMFSKVAELNPGFQTFVGSIEFKASNAHLVSFMELRIFQNEQEAYKELKDSLYTDFIISLAKNYLNSCAPDAVLFTHGDNDTYPLLYVQNQYGFRTDVLVVNVSLLNTYRYINSLREQILDAPGLPISVAPDKYANDKREFLYVTDRLGRPVDLDRILDFAWSDNPQTQIKTVSGDLINFIPTNQIEFPVDNEKFYKSKTVGPENIDLTVDTIRWTINQNYVFKNHLVMLDVLSDNKWERPLYFSIGMGRDNFIGLENYLQLEGLAYRIVPVKKTINDNLTGSINTDILYDNLMNKFIWADTDDKTYTNENKMESDMYRPVFLRLLEALEAVNKTDSARMVVNRYYKVLPEE